MTSLRAHGYWLAHMNVRDPDGYREYLAAAGPVFQRYGAVFLARGGQYEAVEGLARERHIVIQFADYETALACYHDPDYQNAARHRLNAAAGEIVIVEGVQQS